jgi:transcriptional regulator with XRE-family HTH domain
MAPNVRESIAAEVRAELARQRRSQRDVAEAIGMEQPNLQLRLAGKRPFRAEELAALAEHLGVSVGQFYGETSPSAA